MITHREKRGQGYFISFSFVYLSNLMLKTGNIKQLYKCLIHLISTMLGGLLTGLGSLFVVFMLDKLDMFGVNEDERHEFIMGTLNNRIALNIDGCNASYERIMAT